MSSFSSLCEHPTSDTSTMQSDSDNGSYLAIPMASWETNKRSPEAAPDTVSSSPKRSCTPKNTFSSGFHQPVTMDTEWEDATTEVHHEMDCSNTVFRLGNNTTQEALDSACDSLDATGLVEHETQPDFQASTPPRRLTSLEDPDALTPNNDEDPSTPNFNTCLGLVRHITQTPGPLIGY